MVMLRAILSHFLCCTYLQRSQSNASQACTMITTGTLSCKWSAISNSTMSTTSRTISQCRQLFQIEHVRLDSTAEHLPDIPTPSTEPPWRGSLHQPLSSQSHIGVNVKSNVHAVEQLQRLQIGWLGLKEVKLHSTIPDMFICKQPVTGTSTALRMTYRVHLQQWHL